MLDKKQDVNILVLLDAMNNCLRSDNYEWYDKHKDKIKSHLLNVLPHGSGINSDWQIDYTDKAIICRNSYHRMCRDGYYCGWIDFRVKIKGDYRDIWGKIIFSVVGRFGIHQDIKEYLYEIIAESLSVDSTS